MRVTFCYYAAECREGWFSSCSAYEDSVFLFFLVLLDTGLLIQSMYVGFC